MNNPTLAIPTKWRTVVYIVFGLLGVALGAAVVGFATAEVDQPVWLKVAQAVLNFVGAAVGYTAATHVPAAPDYLPNGDGGAVGVLAVVGLLLILVAILGLLGVINLGVAICVVLAIVGLLLLVVDRRGLLRP